jgi:CMP-N,N'-diacetyllegionaminic acid synthase
MKKKIFCFDIDGVICITKNKKYSSAKPINKSINLINQLYEKNYIIIFTARYMGRNKDNVAKAKRQGYNKTFNQLKKWGLKFHELRFGKPSYDIFVDDKNIFFKKNWQNYLKKLKF